MNFWAKRATRLSGPRLPWSRAHAAGATAARKIQADLRRNRCRAASSSRSLSRSSSTTTPAILVPRVSAFGRRLRRRLRWTSGTTYHLPLPRRQQPVQGASVQCSVFSWAAEWPGYRPFRWFAAMRNVPPLLSRAFSMEHLARQYISTKIATRFFRSGFRELYKQKTRQYLQILLILRDTLRGGTSDAQARC